MHAIGLVLRERGSEVLHNFAQFCTILHANDQLSKCRGDSAPGAQSFSPCIQLEAIPQSPHAYLQSFE